MVEYTKERHPNASESIGRNGAILLKVSVEEKLKIMAVSVVRVSFPANDSYYEVESILLRGPCEQ